MQTVIDGGYNTMRSRAGGRQRPCSEGGFCSNNDLEPTCDGDSYARWLMRNTTKKQNEGPRGIVKGGGPAHTRNFGRDGCAWMQLLEP